MSEPLRAQTSYIAHVAAALVDVGHSVLEHWTTTSATDYHLGGVICIARSRRLSWMSDRGWTAEWGRTVAAHGDRLPAPDEVASWEAGIDWDIDRGYPPSFRGHADHLLPALATYDGNTAQRRVSALLRRHVASAGGCSCGLLDTNESSYPDHIADRLAMTGLVSPDGEVSDA